MAKSTYKSSNIRTLTAVGVFAALSYICCVLFHFKAGFLSFDLKDAVMTVGAMLFGPVYGLAMVVIVALLEFFTISGTGVYGLIMNLISSSVYVCTASAIYSRRRTMAGSLVGVSSSVILTTAVMMVANLLITPYYMGASAADVAAMIPTLLFPFNLTKSIFNSSLVFILYSPISALIRSAGFKRTSAGLEVNAGSPASDRRSVIVMTAAVLIAAAALIFFFVNLNGSFSLVARK